MKPKIEHAFFALLRFSLWHNEDDIIGFESMSVSDWNDIFETAKAQALIAVIFDGITSLPKELQPTKQVLFQWVAHFQKIENSNLRINRSLEHFAAQAEEENIKFILIKGQGLASIYPNPLHRQCGDIDIVVTNPKHYRSLYSLMCGFTNSSPKFKVKHVTFNYLDTTLEIHKNIMNLHNPLRIRKVKKIVDKIVERDSYPQYKCGMQHINLLPHSINAVYILKHAFDHLVTFGVGFRQICDWTIFLKTYSDVLDREEVTRLLKLTSLYDAANMFAYVSINYLGLKAEELPFEYKENKERGEFLYNDIISGGNFGTSRKGYSVNKNPILRKANTAFTIFKRSLTFMKFSPSETLWYPFMQIYKVSVSLLRIES